MLLRLWFTKSFSLAAGAFALATALSGCGNVFHPLDLADSQTTGAHTQDGRPYTTSASDGALENLKTLISPDRGQNRKFAAAIANARISVTDSKDGIQISGSVELENFGTPKIEFAFPKTAAAKLSAWNEVGIESEKVFVKCLRDDCSILQLRMKRGSDEAGFVYRNRKAELEVFGPNSVATKSVSPALANLAIDLQNDKNAQFDSIEIAWGKSSFHLVTKPVCLAGSLVETGTVDEDLEVSCSRTPFTARLLGNNASGDIVARLADADGWLFLRVAIERKIAILPDDEGEPLDPKLLFIPVDVRDSATRKWRSDRARAEIVKRIDEYAKDGEKKTRLQNFLNRSKPNLQVLTQPFLDRQLPPELIFTTYLESKYFVDEGFPVEVSHVGAVGPWQFMPDTATWNLIGLKIRPLVSKSKAHACDERGNLRKSTVGAAKYFQSLLRTFAKDPRLALMAYNWGPGNVSNAVKRLNEIETAGFDYWTIRDLRMAPKESLEYVANFIAVQFVGSQPQKYGFQVRDGFPLAPEDLCR